MKKEQKTNLLKFIFLCLFVTLVILFIKFSGISNYITPGMIQEKVHAFGMYAPAVFILMYVLFCIFLIPGTPITIAGGILFGKFFGTAYTIVGATIGASLAFIFSRYLGRGFIKNAEYNKKYGKIKGYEDKLEKKGLLVVLFLRLVPLFPFNGLNFALGLTKLKFRDYALGTLIGIIPGSFVLSYFGDSLANLSIINLIISALLFLMLSLLYPLYKRIGRIKK